MEIDILSLFPDYFKGPFDVSIVHRAIREELISIRHTDVRDFSKDKHKKVDERPFGGGPGMVLTPQPYMDAIRSVRKEKSHVIYLSPQGALLNSDKCRELAKHEHLILACGHYEGVDERVIIKEVDEEISIGDYVLTNGCLAAIVLVDSVIRFIPGVLGDPLSATRDSFEMGVFAPPQFTRPEIYEGMQVPEVLLGGNHAEIEKWRFSESLKKTRIIRPDLYTKYLLENAMEDSQRTKKEKIS